jgi:hypothetical protein
VPDGARRAAQERAPDAIERRAGQIVGHRFVVLSISATLILTAFLCAIVMRIFDSEDYPSLGVAMWWAVQTFTTVGYGDVPPTTAVGRVVGGVLMVVGVMFISFLTASVTTSLIRRDDGGSGVRDADGRDEARAILDGIARLERRLDELEAKLER